MSKSNLSKGQSSVPRSSAARRSEVEEKSRLEQYRVKSACMVHKASGDPEEVCKDGLATFNALGPARERANETVLKKDE
jgi:hypothetical protein